MFALKIVTTTFIALLMLVIFIFCFSLKGRDRDKATYIGFSAMEIVYIMALICMWF